MSTFRGVVQEFPDIRIDFFRAIPGLRPPRKCFLSHVHSDHLAGLDAQSFNGCFIYCSAATREILLRLEKYPQRLNFQLGILEIPPKVTYKHLDKLLKTIPLETPTRIELERGNDIQVTSFDANHCPGAVMFLIEGDNKAILYTGDIRSEPWFVNSLTRNPFLIEYSGGLKRLDCIYLDTSNTRDIPFPTKAEGLKELLRKVSRYPAETVFHFTAWTFGYEEVWMALSRALNSQIHVDEYKMRLYASLRGKSNNPKDPTNDAHLSGPFLAHEGPALTGYKCGNTLQAGCLTNDPNVRIHSCEKGLHCDKLNEKSVWIRPIVTRTAQGEMAEVGVGGGGGDLIQRLEIELDSEGVIDEFLGLFADTDDLVKIDIRRMLSEGLKSRRTALSLDDLHLDPRLGNISLTKVAEALTRSIADKKSSSLNESLTDEIQFEALPRLITFPYARHSSYAELCHLVRVFDPKDVYPCTVDEANWDENASMENLFGRECSVSKFRHDDEMRALQEERQIICDTQQSHTTATSELSSQMLPPSSPVQRHAMLPPSSPVQRTDQTTKPHSLRRNSQGRLRSCDAYGGKLVPAAEHVQKGMTEMRPGIQLKEVRSEVAELIEGTPFTQSQDIVAVSPGSASQNLRRKAIHDGLEGQVKRFRLSYDGPHSSSQSAVQSSASTPQRQHNISAVTKISDESEDAAASTAGSDADSIVDSLPISKLDACSEIQDSKREEIGIARYLDVRQFESDVDNPNDCPSFVDREDRVLRCKYCGHEVWNIWNEHIGFCTSDCLHSHQFDANRVPYYECIEPEAGPRPGFETGDFASEAYLASQDIRDIVGNYLDNDSDAYDTIDEDPDYRSEYLSEDSFIDDASIHESQDRDADEKCSRTDNVAFYKALFNELQRKHSRLVRRHEGVMQDLVGSNFKYNSSSSEESEVSDDFDTEEIDEYGALIVNANAPNPTVIELVLSQAQEQSQESELSAGGIRDRVKAFEAAAGGEWNNISMVSTGDNHNLPEIEL